MIYKSCKKENNRFAIIKNNYSDDELLEEDESRRNLEYLEMQADELKMNIQELKNRNLDFRRNVINIEYCENLEILPRVEKSSPTLSRSFIYRL